MIRFDTIIEAFDTIQKFCLLAAIRCEVQEVSKGQSTYDKRAEYCESIMRITQEVGKG